MSGNFKNLHFHAEKIPSRRFFDEKIWRDRFDFQFKTEIAKEVPVRNHRGGLGMAADLTIETPLDLRNVLDVIDVSVSEQQESQIEIARLEPLAGAIGRVKQNRTLRG